MQQSSHTRRNIAIAIAVVLIGVVIGLTIRQHGARAGKVGVGLYVLPENATVTIGGTKYHEGTVYLAPGSYKVSASASGFVPYSLTYSVEQSVVSPVINVALNPQSAAAQSYVNQHQDLYLQREGLGSQEAHQQSSLILSKNPLTAKLPYSNLLYTIGYRSDPSDPTGQSVIIEIDASIGYRNAAVNQIKSLGFNPADYKINFENYVNPFSP